MVVLVVVVDTMIEDVVVMDEMMDLDNEEVEVVVVENGQNLVY